MTGRANCASSELTTPRLGARSDVTERETIVGKDDGVGVLLLPEFCNSCLSSTFCESSGFEFGTIVMVENLQLSFSDSLWPVDETVSSNTFTLSSFTVTDDSMLLWRLPII